ncbi:hypothetical protein [Virgisporangium ochraceum]|uniref:Uncharacterized protein n=1 Tax=Virgisporangium ochraceum TaxID=65505 RepID=A0A8J4EED7_9ACTN|nr:hypothetical protein [Virgisporangium ochraceum]GIJ71649.1 hypothetical protein Voc01_065660 [Virgisporangium ochraceum]
MSAVVKSLPPAGDALLADQPWLRTAVTGPVSVVEAPPGCLLTEGLAGALGAAGRRPLWLRLDPDPVPAWAVPPVGGGRAAVRSGRRPAGRGRVR